MKKSVKILIEIVLLVVCVLLVFLIYKSIMQPVNFNKQKAYRESVAVERLKDIRTLQVAYKGVNGKYTGSIDTLIQFYQNGKMDIVMQVGSADDSVAVENTARLKKQGVKPEQMLQMYLDGERNLVFSTKSSIAVKDTLFHTRENFHPDSLRTIPFSGGQPVEMKAIEKMVSGVKVPLFEANMPYDLLLKGLDRQLVVNLKADCEDKNRFKGLQVGSVDMPNNNAGNWE